MTTTWLYTWSTEQKLVGNECSPYSNNMLSLIHVWQPCTMLDELAVIPCSVAFNSSLTTTVHFDVSMLKTKIVQ